MSGSTVYAPQCSVEVYPFEGGNYTIQGGQILTVTTDKRLRVMNGSFRITLAPGGPNGTNAAPSWAQVVTPMSLVLIGMQRGASMAIVMVGVVTSTTEAQAFSQDHLTQRSTTIEGVDFGYFFSTFAYYTLGFLGVTAGALASYGASQTGFLSGANVAMPGQLTQSFYFGQPDEIGQNWYSTVMMGASGLLGKTYVPYKGQQITLGNAILCSMQAYSGAFIPVGMNFLTTEGSWEAKFRQMFPFPWYDFFVATAPQGYYGAATVVTPVQPQGSTAPAQPSFGQGFPFTMSSMPQLPPVAVQIVARPSPLPILALSSGSTTTPPSVSGITVAAWNALPITELTNYGPIDNTISFGIDEVRNFYTLQPLGLQTMPGDVATGNTTYLYNYCGAVDPTSLNRYGYRPQISSSYWLYDPMGLSAQNLGKNFTITTTYLLSQVCSYFHPSPLMARAGLDIPLQPDAQIGTRFRFTPSKYAESWDFYIERVTNSFVFGGPSVTGLELSRGLPTAVYADSAASGLLQQVHVGNAQRINGVYASGLGPTAQGNVVPGNPKDGTTALSGGSGLIFYIAGETNNQLKQLTATLSNAFTTPQSTGSNTINPPPATGGQLGHV